MPDEERDLTVEQAARVRRLLADARLEEPVPTDVAARLDRVLARLAAGEPVETDTPAEVVDLAARRRRRAGVMLVAAAAVVAVGVGLGQVVGPADQPDPSRTSLESGDSGSVDRDSAGESAQAPSAESDDETEAAAPDVQAETDADTLQRLGRPASVDEESFAADVRRLQPQAVDDLAAAPYSTFDRTRAFQDGDFACAGAAWGTGIFFAVRYEGKPAVLAFREPAGQTQVAEVLQCGSGDILRSTTLPYP